MMLIKTQEKATYLSTIREAFMAAYKEVGLEKPYSERYIKKICDIYCLTIYDELLETTQAVLSIDTVSGSIIYDPSLSTENELADKLVMLCNENIKEFLRKLSVETL